MNHVKNTSKSACPWVQSMKPINKCSLLALLILTGCAQGGNLQPLNDPVAASYHLGVGDQIRVITYGDAQLNNNFTVGEDGKISSPLVGSIAASGSTTDELASAIAKSLEIKPKFVSVQVVQYHPISVLGEVNHPGQYPFQPGMKMLDAVALAGGFTYRAVTDDASDLRSNAQATGTPIEGRIERSSTLEPGDVITVYERYF
jgi:polysaccharide export outer membrane protein